MHILFNRTDSRTCQSREEGDLDDWGHIYDTPEKRPADKVHGELEKSQLSAGQPSIVSQGLSHTCIPRAWEAEAGGW